MRLLSGKKVLFSKVQQAERGKNYTDKALFFSKAQPDMTQIISLELTFSGQVVNQFFSRF